MPSPQPTTWPRRQLASNGTDWPFQFFRLCQITWAAPVILFHPQHLSLRIICIAAPTRLFSNQKSARGPTFWIAVLSICSPIGMRMDSCSSVLARWALNSTLASTRWGCLSVCLESRSLLPLQPFRWDASGSLDALKRSVKRTNARNICEFESFHDLKV